MHGVGISTNTMHFRHANQPNHTPPDMAVATTFPILAAFVLAFVLKSEQLQGTVLHVAIQSHENAIIVPFCIRSFLPNSLIALPPFHYSVCNPE